MPDNINIGPQIQKRLQKNQINQLKFKNGYNMDLFHHLYNMQFK